MTARTVVVWVAFLAAMLGGAGLLMADAPGLRWAGLALLLAPVALLAYLTLAHYARQRRAARPPG